MKEAAACFNVSPATACRWSRRWREASAEEQRSLTCLLDRSSRPRRMPRLLSAREQRRICAARRQTGWRPRLLTLQTGHPRSTILKVLKRQGLSRPPCPLREPPRRYEWPCPGDLLHLDVSLYPRFERPGHALTVTAAAPALRRKSGLATTTRTRSSTTTAGSPTPSSWTTNARPRSPPSSNVRSSSSPTTGSSRSS